MQPRPMPAHAPMYRHPAPPLKQRYPLVKLPEEKPMTIAAGFRVREGIVLCTDTLYSSDTQTHERKIFWEEHDTYSMAIALAGLQPYARMAIEDCFEALNLLKKPTLVSAR